jgi:hypothetical protein
MWVKALQLPLMVKDDSIIKVFATYIQTVQKYTLNLQFQGHKKSNRQISSQHINSYFHFIIPKKVSNGDDKQSLFYKG